MRFAITASGDCIIVFPDGFGPGRVVVSGLTKWTDLSQYRIRKGFIDSSINCSAVLLPQVYWLDSLPSIYGIVYSTTTAAALAAPPRSGSISTLAAN